jgi:hypothetical protein
MHWPHPDGARGEAEREALIHTLGNLTLLTAKLNTKVSNGPWLGVSGKKHGLEAHDVLFLNRKLLNAATDDWTDVNIRARSEDLADAIIMIWPVPAGHRSNFSHEKVRPRHKVDFSDLISAGSIQPGVKLYPRRKKFAESFAILLPDGRLDLQGKLYASPSHAASAITGAKCNGWWFFLVDQQTRRSLKDIRLEYLESIADDVDEGEEDEEADEDV